MTAIERIKDIIANGTDMEVDSIEKLITIAYMMGREEATEEVSNVYKAHISKQKQRAAACRYSKMAHAVVGEESYIWVPDYDGEFTASFGGDETKI